MGRTIWNSGPIVEELIPSNERLRRDGAIAETADRSNMASTVTLVSGTLALFSITIPTRAAELGASTWSQKASITSITFASGATALSGGSHLWFALYDSDLNLLRQTTDDTSPTWAANTELTKNLTSTYPLSSLNTTSFKPFCYLGVCVVATTPPNLRSTNADSTLGALAPAMFGRSTTGLTGTAPNPAAAITGANGYAYAYVS